MKARFIINRTAVILYPINSQIPAKRKMAFVIPSMQAGGMERVMAVLTNYLCKFGDLEIHLILYGRKPRIFYSIEYEVIIHQPQSKFINYLRHVSTLGRLIYLRRKVRLIDPNVVISFGTLWNRFVLLSLIGVKTPIFISDRGQPNKKYSILHELLGNILYPKSSGIIVQTQHAKSLYEKKYKRTKIYLLNNPIRIPSSRDNKIVRENSILTVGRLIKSKHHDRLIRIFSRLFAHDWKLIIIGGNALKQNNFENLNKLIIELGLQKRVLLTGEIYDLDNYYYKSKIFAFTSSSEGFPNVVGEALSAGLPVVAYDCIAGPSEMVTEGENGFLVPVFDDTSFQQRLQLLIDNDDLLQKMSSKASCSVKKFSVDKIAQQFLEIVLT